MNKEVYVNEEKKKKYALVISFLVLMICIVGSTYAYFAITASNNNISGKVGGSSLDLTVNRVLPTTITEDDEMIPQLEGALDRAISEEYSCIDDNGHLICQVYSATVTNLGSESVTLNGNISFTGIEKMPNLKWKLLADSRTIDSSKTANSASTSNVTFVENLSLTTEDTGKSSTYYFVFWIEETGELQTDNGEFRAIINFDSPNATSGVTSTITPDEEGTAYGAAKTVIDLYNSGEEADYTTVHIGGDTSKPQVTLNTKQKIMMVDQGETYGVEYRYYGNEATEDTANGKYLTKNYVSFNGELWRIISSSKVYSSEEDTTGSQRLRIIRADSIGDHYWDNNGNNNWEEATLNTTLNSLYYNRTSGTCYLDGSETTCDYSDTGTIKGLSEEARSLIDDAVWYLGGSDTYSGYYANDFYTFERGTTVSTEGYPTSTVAKLGIMYPSDYAYATDLGVCTKPAGYTWDSSTSKDVSYSSDTTNCTGTDWLFNSSNYQWTVSPGSGNSIDAFGVYSSGYVDFYIVYDSASGVRPVAVLKSDVTIVEGEGTSDSPYILSVGS